MSCRCARLFAVCYSSNLLFPQACHAAYDVIDESAVYNVTGNPHPADIEAIVESMMNEDFQTSFTRAFRFCSSRVSANIASQVLHK